MLVTLTAMFLSIFDEIEWDIIRLSASVKISTGLPVSVVFHSDKWGQECF